MAVLKKLNPETGQYEPVINIGGEASDYYREEDLVLFHLDSTTKDNGELCDLSELPDVFYVAYPYNTIQYSWAWKLRYASGAYSASNYAMDGSTSEDDELIISKSDRVDGVTQYLRLVKMDISSMRETFGAYSTSIMINKGQSPECYILKKEVTKEDIINGNYISASVSAEFAKAVKVANDISEKVESDFSPLVGKYGLHIGDSYTYAMANSGGAFETLNKKLGMAGTLNHGIVSSTIRDGSNDKGFYKQPMVSRVLNVAVGTTEEYFVPLDREDIGYITFMGGTNDSYAYDSSVGTDIMSGDSFHIYGAVNLILQQLVTSYPDVPIIVILQPSCANTTDESTPEGANISGLSQSMKSVLKSQRKQKAVKEVAELYIQGGYNVHLVDCCFNWHSPLNSDDLSSIWSSDLLHLKKYEEITEGDKYDSVYKKLVEIFS